MSGEEKDLWVGKPFYFGLPSFTKYRITNQRIIAESGILTKRTVEFELFRIKEVSVKRNIIERIFNFGDITVHSTYSRYERYILRNIKDSEHVKDIIRNAVIENTERRKIEFPGQ